MHNVRYGRLDASDDDVVESAKKARVHQTISSLPDGYGTLVGERGLMVSGGEKQRLAVARVLLKDPPILFFDEAVCHLYFRCNFRIADTYDKRYPDVSIRCAHRIRTYEEYQLDIAGESSDEYLYCSSPTDDCRIRYAPHSNPVLCF
jgi:ATP-binding cassette, subfamily B (MDR/TAP), member 7